MCSVLYKFILIVVLLFTTGLHASGLFDDDAILEIELSGPIGKVIQAKKRKTLLPFRLSAAGHSQEVLVRARGHSRIGACKFPPLSIQFKRSRAQLPVFTGYSDLKIVTHCHNSASAQDNAIQEYLAYKIFNQLTDVSYRVRLSRISYIDTEARGNTKPLVRYAFIIEPRTAMAQRLGAKPVAVQGVSLRSLNDAHMSRVYLFQYLIGNTDWSLVRAERGDTCCHNGTLLDLNGQRYYVPYDFDLSGLVNARYAFPDRSLRIKRVTQRLYRGFCLSPERLQETLDEIKNKESNILDITNTLPALSEKELGKTKHFINGFFTESKNTARLLNHIERRCL